jgi:23S rRNA (cytidine1920-2'-O)/16S rRNA (cytidine1409-2'-O)-methyltransferase
VARKAATGVSADAPVQISGAAERQWASRGAHKLLGALDAFTPRGLRVAGRRCLDAGASAGGFTDVLLAHGAARVVAVDVGYGQLAWRLRTDPRVEVHDRTNVRQLSPQRIGGPVQLVVADLSFISLRLVLPALAACVTAEADLLPMVKPQFEVGRQRLGAGGVVREPADRAEAVLRVVHDAAELGLGLRGVVASPLPGPSGNVEYFVWLVSGAASAPGGTDPAGADRDEDGAEVTARVRRAVEEGPQ